MSPFVQAFSVPGGYQPRTLHLLEDLARGTHLLPRSVRGGKLIHRPEGIAMPRYALIRGRKLGNLLLPSAEVAQRAVLIPKDSVEPTIFVQNVVEVGGVENRELLITGHILRPRGIVGLARAVVLTRELVMVTALARLFGVDRVGHPGFSHLLGVIVPAPIPPILGQFSVILQVQGQHRYADREGITSAAPAARNIMSDARSCAAASECYAVVSIDATQPTWIDAFNICTMV